MFCNKCGNQLEDNAVFCAKCGNRVDGAPAPAQKPARPVAPKVTKPVSAATLGYLRISSFALFVLGLILWFGGAPISISYMGAMAMPGLLTHCGGTICTVLAVIFYTLGILASLLPFAGGLIGNNLPENVKALLCKKTYIQLFCAFIAFVFYIVAFSIILAQGSCAINFYCIFSLLLQIAHMGMLYYINTKTN